MKIFWKKNREIIVILLYGLFFGLLIYFAARPLWISINQKVEKIQEEIVNQERRLEKMKEVSVLEKQAELVNREAEKIQVLARREQIVLLLQMIEKIGEETNNEIIIEAKDESVAKTEKGSNDLISQLPSDKYVKMKITISGKYDNSVRFISKLESMTFWADIVSLRISADSASLQSKEYGASPFQKTLLKKNDDKEKEIASAGVVVVVESVFYLDE